MRISLSKKLRFEVFKRDGFNCQYCGNHPPIVVLEVDHVIPVSGGGKNNIDNLATSCFDCNRGKSNIELSSLPQKVADKHKMLAEKEEQYLAYKELQQKIHERIKNEADDIEAIYSYYFKEYCFSDKFKLVSVVRFIEELGYNEVRKAIGIACGKMNNSDSALKYFCGICWNKINKVA